MSKNFWASVDHIAVSPDGRAVLSGCSDGSVVVRQMHNIISMEDQDNGFFQLKANHVTSVVDPMIPSSLFDHRARTAPARPPEIRHLQEQDLVSREFRDLRLGEFLEGDFAPLDQENEIMDANTPMIDGESTKSGFMATATAVGISKL
ncbi:hypothetical protein GSI_09871 [Ganoderma sinense ZZ0214-1]|uniref:Uncharacterized protein n=1 Tax=Ganoderma sinense ZZ0214-1 TaxID=1077348 RepID=A0A2G8S2M0_9APHY|nr:hypothetical protein GSI_09871 [Ganoderma sinense ZZ0214-1]